MSDRPDAEDRERGAGTSLAELMSQLPAQVWVLTSNGDDLWCRRPYTFFFSTGDAAQAFAVASGAGESLWAVGFDAVHLLSEPVLAGLRERDVTRIFVDPRIDDESGDVHGAILRLEALN